MRKSCLPAFNVGSWGAVLFFLTLIPARAQDAWQPVANMMSDGRWAASAALLPGGSTALLAGGYSFQTRRCVASADIFDARARRFTPSHSRLTFPRDFAPAVPLFDGQILIVGGYNTVLGTLRTAELYNPLRDTFTLLPAHLHDSRELFQATLLADGRVLLTGGFDTHSGHTLASAEIFDPQMQAFSRTGAMAQDRFGHAAVRLMDGRVLVVGGKSWTVGHPDKPLASAELWNPATGQWTAAGEMHVPRDRPTATRLADGMVLVAGGQNGASGPADVEKFDPATGQFTIVGQLMTPRMAHSDAVLPDGRILLVGGWSPPARATTAATELFDPAMGQFASGPNLLTSGHDQSLLVFPDGLVLVAGGKQVENGRESSPTEGAAWQSNKQKSR